MLNGFWLATHLSFVILCLGLVVSGIGAHFWILAKLEEGGFVVEYFATATENWRAYITYRRVASERRWPLWPFYLVIGAYVGLAGVCTTLIADHSLLLWLASRLRK
jgi:hypothetical protein